MSSLVSSMEAFVKTIAAEFAAKLEDAVQSGRIDIDSLFDENYIKTEEENKFRNRSNGFFDAEILPLLKQWAKKDRHLIYVVAMDRNGYMPTHVTPSRAYIKMSDQVSLSGAKTPTLLRQPFRRPKELGGDLVKDVAFPIKVGNRHWGCLRIGYIPDAAA